MVIGYFLWARKQPPIFMFAFYSVNEKELLPSEQTISLVRRDTERTLWSTHVPIKTWWSKYKKNNIFQHKNIAWNKV